MKYFIVLGSKTACQYQDIFPLFKERKLFIGFTVPSSFMNTNKNLAGLTRWYSNIKAELKEIIITGKSYYANPQNYPYYDNYPAIECSKIKDIPNDYEGEIGVPITFLYGYYPQYKIKGLLQGEYTKLDEYVIGHQPKLNGKDKFTRVIIQKI